MAERRFAPIGRFEGCVEVPQRKTARSAGYDLAAAAETVVEPGKIALVPTGLKAYMEPDDVLLLTIRSSVAVKRGLMLANGVGVIDSDYVDNPENEGHIMIALANMGSTPVVIAAGERVAQGLFVKYLATVHDAAGGNRQGGFGSTGAR